MFEVYQNSNKTLLCYSLTMHFISCEQEFAMVDVKTEGKERETDDLKAKLQEEGT